MKWWYLRQDFWSIKDISEPRVAMGPGVGIRKNLGEKAEPVITAVGLGMKMGENRHHLTLDMLLSVSLIKWVMHFLLH